MLNIKKTLTKILALLDSPVMFKQYITSGLSSTTWYLNKTLDVSLSGYKPIYMGFSINLANCYVFSNYLNGNTAQVSVAKRDNTGTLTSLQITWNVIYIKDTLYR